MTDDLDLFLDNMDDIIVSDGKSDVVFTCVTRSLPPGAITWFARGIHISSDDTRYTTSNLVRHACSCASVQLYTAHVDVSRYLTRVSTSSSHGSNVLVVIACFAVQVNTTSTIATVTSQLVIHNPVSSDSGVIQCLGFVNDGIDSTFESSKTTLTVIGTIIDEERPICGYFIQHSTGNGFIPVITFAENCSLLLSMSFPNDIPHRFKIHIRYMNLSIHFLS